MVLAMTNRATHDIRKDMRTESCDRSRGPRRAGRHSWCRCRNVVVVVEQQWVRMMFSRAVSAAKEARVVVWVEDQRLAV